MQWALVRNPLPFGQRLACDDARLSVDSRPHTTDEVMISLTLVLTNVGWDFEGKWAGSSR